MEQETENTNNHFGGFWHMNGVTQNTEQSKEFLMSKILERAKEIRDTHFESPAQENNPLKK